MVCWAVCGQPPVLRASDPSPPPPPRTPPGQLALLHRDVAVTAGGGVDLVSAPHLADSLRTLPALEVAQQRSQLEASLAAAQVLREPEQYRRWLACYVKFLVAYTDLVGSSVVAAVHVIAGCLYACWKSLRLLCEAAYMNLVGSLRGGGSLCMYLLASVLVGADSMVFYLQVLVAHTRLVAAVCVWELLVFWACSSACAS